MTTVESATKILDTMLGHLGFPATIEQQETPDGPCLQIHTGEGEALIGKQGDRLDDLQYLVNRIVRRHNPKAERIRVDCGHFRDMQEDSLASEVKAMAERVRNTGKPAQVRPLNAYYRRLVYNVLIDDKTIVTSSPPGDDRLKQITISPKSNAS